MIAALFLPLLSILAEGPIYEAEYIFPRERIHNHSSSIVETPEGDLIVCWFHGSGERTADDVKVLGSRKRKGSSTWETPFLMADTPELPDCNPVLFMDPRGVLWLFWVTIQNNQWGGALLKYRTARAYHADGPPKWDWQDVIHTRPSNLETRYLAMLDTADQFMDTISKFVPNLKEEIAAARTAASDKLSSRLGWMTRTSPILLQDGRLMLGLYSDVFNCSLAAFTADWGTTWVCSEPILFPAANMLGNIQPAFVQRKDGAIVAFMRDNGIPHYVRTAVSRDGGQTWGEYGHLEVRDSGASVACISLKSGRWLLVNNSLVSGRHELVARLSEDEGATWPHVRHLEKRMDEKEGSFSYPSVIQAADGAIHATYSYRDRDEDDGKTIKHVRFNEAWVMQQP